MNWITDHWKDVGALIGALYVLAIIVVKLTPTPKDDAALEQVNLLLKAIAKVFGLDLKQGINRKTKIICFLLGTSMITNCATINGIKEDPAKQYQLSALTFTESVNVLTAMRKAGKFDENDIESITRVINLGQDILKSWHQALNDGRDYPGSRHMAPIILQLKDFAEARR